MTASTPLPDPLVPPDTDIAGLPSFMLDVERLFASELYAVSTGDEFKAAVSLWGRAWQQVPPGSIPNDERTLAAFSGAGTRWKKVREMALRGFVLCSDGRLYHKVLCADVLRAAKHKDERRQRTAAATEARRRRNDGDTPPPDAPKSGPPRDRHGQRNDQRNDGRHVERNDERDGRHIVQTLPTVTSTHRQDRTGQKKERNPGDPCDPVPREPGPGRAEWASRSNFDRVEARCRRDLPGGGPQDLAIGPMAKLEADGLDLEAEIIPALLDVAAAARTPIRTWRIYADRIAERITAQRQARTTQGLAPVPAAPPNPAEMVDLGSPYGAFSEPLLRVFLDNHRRTGGWMEHLHGPAPGKPGCRIPPRLMIEEAA